MGGMIASGDRYGRLTFTAQVLDGGRWRVCRSGSGDERDAARRERRDPGKHLRYKASAYYYDGTIDVNGAPKRKLMARYGTRDLVRGETRAEVQRKVEADLTGALRLATARTAVVSALSSRSTVAQLVAEWFAQHDVSAGTRRTYGAAIAAHIAKGPMSVLTLRDASTGVLWRHIEGLQADDGKGLATARSVRTILSGAFTYAVRHDVLTSHPLAGKGLELRAKAEPARRKSTLTPAELTAMLDAAEADARWKRLGMSVLMQTMAALGARIGEVLALRWDDIDLGEAPSILIGGKTVRRESRPSAETDPEGYAAWRRGVDGVVIDRHGVTKRFERTVPITTELANVLLAWRMEPPAGNSHGVVFPSPSGNVADASDTNAELRKIAEAAGVEVAKGRMSHLFRRSVITHLAVTMALPEAEVGNLVGQRDARTTRRYISTEATSGTSAATAAAMSGWTTPRSK